MDPNTGSYSVTVQLDDDSDFSSVDFSDATSGFSTFITRRRSSMDAGDPTNYTDFNPVWNTDHWDYSVDDFAVYAASTNSNVAIPIPFHPTSASISNIAVSFDGTPVSEGSAESTSDAWWWESSTDTLYIQHSSLGTTQVDVDLDFDSDTDLFATRFDRVNTVDMGNRLFYNGLAIANQYWTTFVYGGGHEGAGGQAESRAHESGQTEQSVDCMERVAIHVDDDETVCDSSGYYTCNIKWQQEEWADYITEESNTKMTVVANSDDTASTGWAQQLDNDIAVERTQTFYSEERFIRNQYDLTNNDTSSHKYPLVWEREQWIGGDQQVNDRGRFEDDSSDVDIEERASLGGLTCPWITAYDNSTFGAMGIIFDENDLADYGYFLQEPVLTNTSGAEWPIVVDNKFTQITEQTGFEHTFSSVSAGETVSFTFWQWLYDTTSWSNIESALDSDCGALNATPYDPTSLAQNKTDDTNIVVADWLDESSVKFTATATDESSSDNLSLCVEVDPLGTAFSNTEDSCGTAVAYSGSGVTVTNTVTGLTQGEEYHWQVRVKDELDNYSNWVSFSSNTETERDFGIDTTGPSSGSVNDGGTIGSDIDENDGSLTETFANWSGYSDSESGLEKYQYAIGTTAGGTDIVNWTDKTDSGNLFNDNFESGNLSNWDATSTDSGDLDVHEDAAFVQLYGLSTTIDDANSIYAQDNFTSASSYYARLYVNPNSLTMSSGDTFTIADVRDSTTIRASLELNYDGANYRVRGVSETGPQTTSWVNIGETSWSSVELYWYANSSAVISIWVDGVQYDTSSVDTSGLTVDNIQIGMVSDRDTGTSGTFYIDNFSSDNSDYIGPLSYLDETISTSGHLRTGQVYYVSVRAVNNAGSTSSAENSDGFTVLPTFSFSVNSSSISFSNLNEGNSWTDTQTTQTTTSTNAYNGYVVSIWSPNVLTNTANGIYTISNYSGTNTSPTTWSGTGFGYTTNDSNLSGGTADRFTSGGPNYAGFVFSGYGDPVADHTTAVTGTTGAVSSEQFDIGYRVTVNTTQEAGPYETDIIIIATPIF